MHFYRLPQRGGGYLKNVLITDKEIKLLNKKGEKK